MGRLIRITYPGAWHHVMNRGLGRQNIFKGNDDYNSFLSILDELTTKFNVELHAYCLMTNHYHLLMYTPDGNISLAMKFMNGVYTQRYNKQHHSDGPLFRGRFKSTLVDRDAYFLPLSRYIHLNPW